MTDVEKARAVLAAATPGALRAVDDGISAWLADRWRDDGTIEIEDARAICLAHALAGPALALLEAAEAHREAATMNLGPCTIPYHNGEPCYECHIAGEQARAEHEAEARVTAALDSMRAALREAVGT